MDKALNINSVGLLILWDYDIMYLLVNPANQTWPQCVVNDEIFYVEGLQDYVMGQVM